MIDLLLAIFWVGIITGFSSWAFWLNHKANQQVLARTSPMVEENVKAWAKKRKEIEKLNKK